MENVLKFVLLAVGVIFVAILIANAVSLYTTGKSLLDMGKNLLHANTSTFTEVGKTQYEDSSVNGSQVVELIKQYWVDSNEVAICVCTKDGTDIMYDYSGDTYKQLNDLTGFPTSDAKGNALAGLDQLNSRILQCSIGEKSAGVTTFDSNLGYKEPKQHGGKGVINRTSGIFKGKVQYDVNDNIRCITFVQQ